MSDELFTEQVPTESGWYYWKRFKRERLLSVTRVICGRDYTWMWCRNDWVDVCGLFGPRIPTPEQCRELNQKPA